MKDRLPEHNTGPVEDDPEYMVLVQSNNLTVDLDNETLVVHRFIRDHYAPRFPELESLVLNPVEFARAVQMIGNEEDLTTLDFKSFLPSATIMVITVTATTTNGRSLTKEELARVMSACDVALELDAAKRRIQEYVESRMSFIAPNLTAILGSTVATKLMGHAGGLTALSKIPACNILVLGAQKKTNTGLSRISMGRHAGFVYQCDLVQQLPDELRRKAARLMSAKCALAARIDCVRESVDGMAGKLYREDIEKKIAVMLQPPPSQKTKALPIPDEGPKKRRGGRRVRKAKERTAQTDLRKAQNRMVFGEAEEEYGFGDETVGLGMVGRQTGKIRGTQLDTRVKVSVAKKHRAFASHSAHTSGLSSSVAFTPVKGIELENPEIALQRVKEANIKYFSGGQFKKPAAK
ncbi:U4/U6-U5 snRNP complex subunit prp31, variant 3 [Batrachochytrium dendrobatidis]|nr:U4/U6-U5 snRNP complex subunit prp31, variant 3 [Batrachochytrium dendrobatidis]